MPVIIGEGGKSGVPAGHKKHSKFLEVSGCRHHDNCLTCPFDDCVWSNKIMELGDGKTSGVE